MDRIVYSALKPTRFLESYADTYTLFRQKILRKCMVRLSVPIVHTYTAPHPGTYLSEKRIKDTTLEAAKNKSRDFAYLQEHVLLRPANLPVSHNSSPSTTTLQMPP